MQTQPDELRRLVADRDPAQAAAQRIAGRRTWLVGIGTSWHAAHHGAWLLGAAGARRLRAARRRRRAVRTALRRGRRRHRAQPHRPDGLHGAGARGGTRGRGDGDPRHRHRQGRGPRDRRPRDLVRLHREPHRRAHAPGPDGRGARRRSRRSRRRARRRGRRARRARTPSSSHPTGSSSSWAPAPTRGPRRRER